MQKEKNRKEPVIAFDIQEDHQQGAGPYVSVMNIINSDLKERYDFKTITYKNHLGRGISIKRILDLRKQIKIIKPDIVHFSGLQLVGFHIAVACRLAGIDRCIVTIHGFAADNINMPFVKRIIMGFIIEPFTLLLSRKIIGVSNFVVSRKMVKLFAYKQVEQIYNIPSFLPTENKCVSNSIKKELGIRESDTVAVTVSRITKEKGCHILEQVIRQLEEIKDLKFVVVGTGDYLEEMKINLTQQILSKKVFLLGYRSDIPNILAEGDMFILPTLHETLSIALLEASAAGLGIIASETGGIPEIVDNGVNGILVPTNDVVSLKKAIFELYENKSMRENMGRNAAQKLAEKFSSREIQSKLNSVYQNLLHK